MMNSKKMIRIVVSSVLLVAIVATCVGVYKTGSTNTKKEQSLAEETKDTDGEELAANDSQDMQEEESQESGTENVEGTKEVEDQPDQNTPEAEDAQAEQNTQENPEAQDNAANESAATENVEAEAPEINFSESSLMEWPLNGDVLLDYSMDKTVYFPTLNEYKYNPAIVISSDVNAPVLAAANGQVLSITTNEETGTTLTMDMGNGYQAVYGQLKEVPYEEGDTVASGSVIGYISEPTKYYSVEGSNLYFEMTKDGTPIDPVMYLP